MKTNSVPFFHSGESSLSVPFAIINPKSDQGFSMVELALAIAVIAIGLVPIIALVPNFLTSNRHAIEATEVAFAAQGLIEYDFAPNHTPSTLALFTGSFSTNPILHSQHMTLSNVVTYVTATNIYTSEPFSETNSGPSILKSVRISYYWPPNSLNPQKFTFVTEIAATRDIRMN
jgi:prepilin-type N-terminal cleavage/methylation domain-containing protein